MISLEEFDKIDMRVGTIIEAKINKGARKPAYKLKIDLGKDLGIKNSSAQLTELYTPEDLVGKQVIVVVNFNPIRIADIKSEVRILGAENKEGCIILTPERQAQNGSKIY
ncbi:tRNA-binding protein [bacterium]|jgi:export-related chaperone csaA|nr:tRNA-binding protein [bacterium]